MKIQIDHLIRRFGKKNAVNDISFEFESGNIFGFIGPNGAGKTTTIKIMATLDQPTAGDVFFDGVSTIAYPEKVRRIVGYMPDSLPAFTDIKVWEYLDFYARAFGLKGENRRKTLADVEAFTNLTGIRDKYLNTLSKGMKQRVSLARALVHNPQVLIMDEPAAGLDPRARIELLSLLKILAGLDTDLMGTVQVAKGTKIGYLPQEPQLDDSKTVGEVVAEASPPASSPSAPSTT